MGDFLEPYIKGLNSALEGKIDFVGQEQVDKIAKQIIWSSAGLSFLIGFIFQSLRLTFGIFSIGLLGCCAVILPPYPSYNSNPVKWQPAQVETTTASTTTESESKKDK